MTGQTYRIHIQTHLDARWTSWFEGMTIELTANGETLLTGYIPDQAALFSTLMKIRDLGLVLTAVEAIGNQPESNE